MFPQSYHCLHQVTNISEILIKSADTGKKIPLAIELVSENTDVLNLMCECVVGHVIVTSVVFLYLHFSFKFH